ncbi:MAG: nuclear transport factor 2 family protein [Thermoanaerobaculia bacterium]|nr:nuclear transport factor 2 family protein [Thermoanaerobaculia bacterium]
MKGHRRNLAGALALLALLSAGEARAAEGDAGEPEAIGDVAAEVTALLAAQAAAWSRGDLDAFCSIYAEDTLFLSPSGLTRGRAEVLARYRQRYPDAAAMGRLTLEVLEVRPGSDQAGVAARWTLAYPDRPELSGLTLLVLARHAEAGWQIVQDASF